MDVTQQQSRRHAPSSCALSSSLMVQAAADLRSLRQHTHLAAARDASVDSAPLVRHARQRPRELVQSRAACARRGCRRTSRCQRVGQRIRVDGDAAQDDVLQRPVIAVDWHLGQGLQHVQAVNDVRKDAVAAV